MSEVLLYIRPIGRVLGLFEVGNPFTKARPPEIREPALGQPIGS